MDGTNTALEAFARVLGADSAPAYRQARRWVVLYGLLLLGTLLYLGSTHIRIAPFDLAILYDGAWRLLQGQRPHADYYSPLGVVPQALTALGYLLAPAKGNAIAYGNLVLLALVLPLSWRIARSRLSAALAAGFVVIQGLLLAATCPLNTLPNITAYCELYNRQGYALTVLLALVCLLPPRRDERDLFAATVGGALLATLFFLKVSYFVVGGMLIVAMACFLRRSAAWWLVFLGAFTLAAVGWLSLCGFKLGALGWDYAIAGQVNSRSVPLKEDMTNWLLQLAGPLLLVPYGLFILLPAPNEGGNWPRVRLTVFWTVLIVAGTLACLANSRKAWVSPLWLTAAFIAVETIRRWYPNNPRPLAGAFALILLLASGVFRDAQSLAYSLQWHVRKAHRVPEELTFHTPQLQGLVCVNDALDEQMLMQSSMIRNGMRRAIYVEEVNDGLALLTPHVTPQSRVMVLGFSNIFSYALKLPPPRGDALWWHFFRTYDSKWQPTPEKTLATVTHVMRPRKANPFIPNLSQTANDLAHRYGDYLNQNFAVRAESEYWTLLVRQPRPAPVTDSVPVAK